jgi:diguanylate cyclase (GGDEF)-like protein/PAS domain S-box-containing protein
MSCLRGMSGSGIALTTSMGRKTLRVRLIILLTGAALVAATVGYLTAWGVVVSALLTAALIFVAVDRVVATRVRHLAELAERLQRDAGLAAGETTAGNEFDRTRRVIETFAATLGVRQTEQRVMEMIPDMLFILDPDGRVIRWNKAAEAATGRGAEELDRLSFVDLIVPEERELVFEAIRRGMASEVEARLLRPDGTSFPLHWNCASLQDSQGRPIGLVGIGRDITDRRHAEETIRQLAYYDSLTSLPNRAMAHERLALDIRSAERRQSPVAFLLMDLNDFKAVNNTLGHHHGDLVLQQIGPRLRDILRQSDTVARLGGDEFGVVLPDTDLEGALRVAKKAHHVLSIPFPVEGLSIAVEASIGIALFPAHGASAALIMQHADVAMYGAKHNGGGSAVYAADRDHYSARRLALMGELRYAIEHQELTLYFQPKIHMQTRRAVGVEALVRWKHPHRGMIPPDEFIPLAERSGLIRPLTEWVLAAAMDQAGKWERQGFQLSVAVNLSARNLLDAQLPEHLEDLLRRTGTPPTRLELEITESTIMADPARALEVLTRLHDMGVPLAIDDFGTGYSSLGYLKRLPVSAVKIDKSFVKNMADDDNDAVIVRSTIELAHNLGLQVVAEGVETSYLWDRLVGLGCDAAQGYYISPPMAADALSTWFVDAPWQVAMIPPASAADAA